MKKKLTAAVLSVVMLLMSGSVFAAGWNRNSGRIKIQR